MNQSARHIFQGFSVESDKTHALGDFDILVLVLARPPRRSISDNLLQGRLQVRRLRRAQPDKPRLGSRAEPLAELLKQEVLGGDVGARDDEACRDFAAEN